MNRYQSSSNGIGCFLACILLVVLMIVAIGGLMYLDHQASQERFDTTGYVESKDDSLACNWIGKMMQCQHRYYIWVGGERIKLSRNAYHDLQVGDHVSIWSHGTIGGYYWLEQYQKLP